MIHITCLESQRFGNFFPVMGNLLGKPMHSGHKKCPGHLVLLISQLHRIQCPMGRFHSFFVWGFIGIWVRVSKWFLTDIYAY